MTQPIYPPFLVVQPSTRDPVFYFLIPNVDRHSLAQRRKIYFQLDGG